MSERVFIIITLLSSCLVNLPISPYSPWVSTNLCQMSGTIVITPTEWFYPILKLEALLPRPKSVARRPARCCDTGNPMSSHCLGRGQASLTTSSRQL
ncbi:hypothetical protein RRG08_029963 [Elysia crispata]|uniref:Secreted protein n=1 Tax=Elysia crispata TaxID=231223 RepID=A0AAE1DI52_9GAST|nr:hypothetical protein RRG08_029963 [Elysia crispata]